MGGGGWGAAMKGKIRNKLLSRYREKVVSHGKVYGLMDLKVI